jgi:hydroxyethylthiazole kinase-like uncharacterized protein yjeF
MKIFGSEEIREIDECTIKQEPVASVDLMERAAGKLFRWITDRYGRSEHFVVFAGPGNNGGDGLALSRMLAVNEYKVDVHYIRFTDKTSADWKLNLKRLEKESDIRLNYISSNDNVPQVYSGDIVIDAIFGSGLSRPVSGLTADVIKLINSSDAVRISVDIPSGLLAEDNTLNQFESVVRADFTLSFQFPKLSFMFAENFSFVGEWTVLPIGLDESAIRNLRSPYIYLENKDILPLLKKRNKFDHKGKFGHGLLIAGSSGKTGAAVLGAEAALRSGIGLLTCHIPSCCCNSEFIT